MVAAPRAQGKREKDNISYALQRDQGAVCRAVELRDDTGTTERTIQRRSSVEHIGRQGCSRCVRVICWTAENTSEFSSCVHVCCAMFSSQSSCLIRDASHYCISLLHLTTASHCISLLHLTASLPFGLCTEQLMVGMAGRRLRSGQLS